jgi:hypothetical protein
MEDFEGSRKLSSKPRFRGKDAGYTEIVENAAKIDIYSRHSVEDRL